MSSEDHFNWPSAGRADTMYLATIRDEPAGFTRKRFFTEKSPNLNITDIEKARPHYQGYQFTQKEVYANRNDDIEGSFPKKLHQPLAKVHYDLRNEDIQGSKPQSHKFVTTRNPTNPLNPEYKLAQVEVRVATPPKFIRDCIDIKDIDGARPNPYTRYNIQRKTNDVEDIDGAKPKKEWLPQGKHSSLDVKDINSFWEFHTKRQTDPLSPRYKIVNENNQLYEYGQLDNKVMARHPKEVNKVTSLDLKTDDIEGAQAGTSVQHLTKIITRDDYMKTQDIPGAQVATLKKGMTTARHVNPIWPMYTIPGHSEPPPIYSKNFMGTASTKYGATSASGFGVKSEVISPAAAAQIAQASKKSQDLQIETGNTRDIFAQPTIERKPSGGEANHRRASGDKTPLSQGSQSRGNLGKVTSPLMRTGEEVLNVDRNNTFSKNTEYVPARMASKEDIAAMESFKQQKSGPLRFNLETKKALNSNETYQKNIKNFYGLSADENVFGSKSSAVEKLDKYISK